jgi:hypothetical protein
VSIQYRRVQHRIPTPLKGNGEPREQAYLDPHFVEVLDSAPYRAQPATEDDLAWITTKTAQLHHSHATPLENKRAWFRRNPYGFWVVRNRYGALVGSCELIPVDCSVIADLASGKIHEKDKPPELVISYEDRSKVRCVYLENTMALLPTNEPNPWAFYAIFSAAPRIVEALGLEPEGVRIYAMSATHFYTELGPRSSTHEKLLRRLGFEIVSETTAQHLSLFGADLANVVATSRDLIKNIEGRKSIRSSRNPAQGRQETQA